jgi:hypothetical protein
MRSLQLNRVPPSLLIALLGVALLSSPGPALGNTPAPTTESPSSPAPLPEAPFGLAWLMSKAEVSHLGLALHNRMSTMFGETYSVSQLPKDMPDLQYAVLSFGYDDRLIRITAIGGASGNDYDGARIKVRYGELQQILKEKYGEGRKEIHIDKEHEGTNFALGLRRRENRMYTVFTPRDLRIELSVLSEDAARTSWRIIFEYLPGMSNLEQHRKQVEEEAL